VKARQGSFDPKKFSDLILQTIASAFEIVSS
jgi:hypothetical protein